MNDQRLATALGWFSIGLGLAEIIAPKRMGKAIGLKHHQILPFLGVREITSGIGILTQQEHRKRGGWVFSRVVGDMMDLAVLGAAFGGSPHKKARLAAATAAVAGVTVLDMLCSRNLHQSDGQVQRRPRDDKGIHAKRAIVINRPAAELYAFWRNFENLPCFMRHLESVSVGDSRSHWVAKAPLGGTVEWDAEIIEERQNQLIAWRSVEGSDVQIAGSVRFEPAIGGRGTIVRVNMQVKPPGGKIVAKLARFFAETPDKQTGDDLRRFKQLMETGEIPTTEGQPSGRRTSTSHRYDKTLRQYAEA